MICWSVLENRVLYVLDASLGEVFSMESVYVVLDV